MGSIHPELPGYALRFTLSALILGLLPLLGMTVLGPRKYLLSTLGLCRPRGGLFSWKLFPVIWPAFILIGVSGAFDSKMEAFYPYSKYLTVLNPGVKPFLLHAALYAVLYYLPWELLFRGIMILPFLRVFNGREKLPFSWMMCGDSDLVYHIAARTSDWGSRQDFEKDNIQATVTMLDAAQEAGVRHFVYVSSLSVHGFGPHRNSTEQGPYYQESKRRAENMALSRHCQTFQVAVIRPGNVYGPDDTTMMFPLFEAIEKGRMGMVNGGRTLTPPIY